MRPIRRFERCCFLSSWWCGCILPGFENKLMSRLMNTTHPNTTGYSREQEGLCYAQGRRVTWQSPLWTLTFPLNTGKGRARVSSAIDQLFLCPKGLHTHICTYVHSHPTMSLMAGKFQCRDLWRYPSLMSRWHELNFHPKIQSYLFQACTESRGWGGKRERFMGVSLQLIRKMLGVSLRKWFISQSGFNKKGGGIIKYLEYEDKSLPGS